MPRIKSVDEPGDSLSTKSAAIRRGLSAGAVIAARVAEASKQKLLERYRERYTDISGRTGTMQNQSRGVSSMLVVPPDNIDLTTSFEVLDPTSFIPRLLDVDERPSISSTTSNDRFVYIPILAFRRQRVGDEERYHEDPAVVDVAVSFRDASGDPILPVALVNDDDDEEEEDVFSLMNTTPWTCESRNVKRFPELNQEMLPSVRRPSF